MKPSKLPKVQIVHGVGKEAGVEESRKLEGRNENFTRRQRMCEWGCYCSPGTVLI